MRGDQQRQAAIAWAKRGFRVFPLVAGTKVPLRKGWTESATADVNIVAALWTDPVTGAPLPHNIGCLTDDMIVVDADTKGGKNGIQNYIDLDLPLDTLTTRTPSGGRHFYLAGPSKSLSAGKLGVGLDIRSYHGYVVAPGSWLDPENPENKGQGGFYTLDADCEVAEAPPALLGRLDEPLERQSKLSAAELDTAGAVLEATRYLKHDAPLAVEGLGGDHLTFRVACAVKDRGVSETVALHLMFEEWNDRCSPPWDYPELKQKVANAYGYGAKAAGVDTPEAEFGSIDIPSDTAAPSTRAWVSHGDAFDVNIAWLFYRLLPQLGVAVLTAPSQSGKTFLLIWLARCLALGQSFFGIEPDEPGGTIFLFGGTEGSGFAQRLQALEEKTTMPISACQIGALTSRTALEKLDADIAAQAERMQEKHGVPLRLIVFETLSSSGLLEDENDNGKAAQAIANLAALGRRHKALVMFSHHPTKDKVGSRGAGALTDNADFHIEIVREKGATLRDVFLSKARNAEQRPLGSFTLCPVVLGKDAKGREVSSAVVSTSDGPPRARVSHGAPKNAQLLMDSVDWAVVDEGREIDGVMCCEVEAAKAIFGDRKPGSRDRSNIHREWKTSLAWCEEVAAVRVFDHVGRRYIAKTDVSL